MILKMDDIVFNIIGFLDVRDIINCSYVNKIFNATCKNMMLWRDLVKCDFKGTKLFKDNYYETYELCYGLTKMLDISDESNIDDLYLSDRFDICDSIIETIPTQIGYMTNLKKIYIECHKIATIPTQIGQLTNLVDISFMNNKITSLPTEIGQLTNLKELYMDNNCLSSLPDQISQLTNLEELYINNNYFSHVPDPIYQLTNLKRLSIEHQKLIIPENLQNIHK